ncbi:hypothetical protein BT96DRAFT_996583 [Gymnopus androsaceus JB14]|uniref:Protein kinase domain-containing protein n=1 Tax=Gymnopus androsaceus JB14 TaxID=1447944 RepID=A0A6A4HFF5_9AGAR|nr:hypothetical protein BT96DRAFT_996583 [Gymnopus androsaceus JB14]
MFNFRFIFALIFVDILCIKTYAAPFPLSRRELVEPLKEPWVKGYFTATEAQKNALFTAQNAMKVIRKKPKFSLGTKAGVILIDEEHSKLPEEGDNNVGVYRLAGKYKSTATKQEYNGADLIMKVINQFANTRAYEEVVALEIAEDYVDSGTVVDAITRGVRGRVIIMRRKDGISLHSTPAFKDPATPLATKREMEQTTIRLTCTEVAKKATNKDIAKRILHGDNKTENVLVMLGPDGKTVVSINLIDWGYPGIYSVNEKVTYKAVYDWCIETSQGRFGLPPPEETEHKTS